MSHTDSDIEEEQRHFATVIKTFKQYSKYSLSANNRRRKDLYSLPHDDQQLLIDLGYRVKLDEVDKAITENAKFLDLVVADPEIFGPELANAVEDEEHHDAGHDHSHSHSHGHTHSHSRNKVTEFDVDKLWSTLKQFVREWSAEGKMEREASYQPMKDALLAHFSDIPQNERRNFRVLVPGVGLARLAWDVASLGFACQGNEFSHYMLLSSFLILNKTNEINKYTIYPYVHSFSNITRRADILRAIQIPDVDPSALPEGSDFSLVAGDFEDIYGAEDVDNDAHAGEWDAIMTCFFIDTAKNIVNYLRILHRLLAPGGIWINLGPLLWHFENNNTHDPSVELDLEEVKVLAREIGFELSNEKSLDTTYTNNSQSMLGYVYKTAFWTATKIP